MPVPNESLRERNRRAARDAVLDAAERLLKSTGDADFSMRALAAEAGVGFATPFNHFKSKTEIMRAISSRLINAMTTAFLAKKRNGDLIDRAMTMCDVTVHLILQQPDVYRAVIGSLGVASSTPSAVMLQSKSLWGLVLDGSEDGLAKDISTTQRAWLSEQLAITFRGCLSFWVAGEIDEKQLAFTVRRAVAGALLGQVTAKTRQRLLKLL